MKDFAVSSCLEYDTPKVVTIRSRFIGVINRIVQLAIILYVVVWVFIIHHGYQFIETSPVSGTTTKLKGVAYTNSTDPRVGQRLWDAADLNVPPEENGAFFLTTNVIVTHNQTQGECTETSWQGSCSNDSDCTPEGTPYHLGHGVTTGRCDIEAGQCVVKAWCPIENDDLPAGGERAMLEQTKDFTVFVKNHVYFPHYKKTRSNLIELVDKAYMRSCRYHHEDEPYCPIFRLADIVSIATTKASGDIRYEDRWYKEMAIKGGVISISVKWDCNFDRDESECKPKYVFDRLDNYGGNTIAAGYNFRYPIYYQENGQNIRQLVKAYGILFTLGTEASARKFDIVTFLMNVGSGLALLGIASVCCDLILLNVHRKKKFFKNHIFVDVEQPAYRRRATLKGSKSELSTTTGMTADTSSALLSNGDHHRSDSKLYNGVNSNNHNNSDAAGPDAVSDVAFDAASTTASSPSSASDELAPLATFDSP